MKKILAPVLFAISALAAQAGQFSVAPLRLDLTDAAPAGSVSVTNDSDEPLRLKMSAVRWTQDDKGKDSFQATDDIAFFPLEVEVAPGAKRVVRAKLKRPGEANEKAYRLFLEEIPAAGGSANAAKVAVAVKFGVAVWHKAAEAEKLSLVFKPESFKDGTGQAWVVNNGNTHVRLNGVVSEQLTAGELKPWYLLPGAARKIEYKADAAVCKTPPAVVADTDEGKLPAALTGALCQD